MCPTAAFPLPSSLHSTGLPPLRLAGDVFIPRGVDVNALDHKRVFEFNPTNVKVWIRSLPASRLPMSCCGAVCRLTLLTVPNIVCMLYALHQIATVVPS